MLWFNTEKDIGVFRTDEGERVEITGDAFAPGEKPVERCARKVIEFTRMDGAVGGIAFVPEVSPRRARLRRSR